MANDIRDETALTNPLQRALKIFNQILYLQKTDI